MTMLSRGFIFLIDFILTCWAWYYAFYKYDNWNNHLFKKLVRSLPGTILIYFGCYCLY